MSRPKRILLVDDSDNDVQLIQLALAKRSGNHEVTVAHDGVDAVDFLCRRGAFESRATANPDVILLDLKMPRMDGLEVLRHVKADADLRTIPIVMLTSSREECDVLKSYQLGVNAYVVKPVDFQEFVCAIAEIEVFWARRNEAPPLKAETAKNDTRTITKTIAANGH